MTVDRAQAHTLEGFMAALLIVSGVLFALDATAVTPLSASTSNQHIQNQQRHVADDLLATASANGTLRTALVDWNRSNDGFRGEPDDGYFTSGGPPNAFGAAINETFRDRRVAVNVEITYWDGSSMTQRPIVYMGSPSDNAVTASRSVTLYDDTNLADGSTNVSAAGATDAFYAPDASPGSELYTVVEVRLTAWRM